jgi:hypothetical protein
MTGAWTDHLYHQPSKGRILPSFFTSYFLFPKTRKSPMLAGAPCSIVDKVIIDCLVQTQLGHARDDGVIEVVLAIHWIHVQRTTEEEKGRAAMALTGARLARAKAVRWRNIVLDN